MKIPTAFKPDDMVMIPDSREQHPYTESEIAPMRMAEPQGLDFADYTYFGGMQTTRAERKSLADLLQSMTRERKRFEKEIRGLLGFPHRVLIVESSWPEIFAGEWRNQVTPQSVIGTLVKYQTMGLPVILAGDRKAAARFCAKFMHLSARETYRNARELLSQIPEGEGCQVTTA